MQSDLARYNGDPKSGPLFDRHSECLVYIIDVYLVHGLSNTIDPTNVFPSTLFFHFEWRYAYIHTILPVKCTKLVVYFTVCAISNPKLYIYTLLRVSRGCRSLLHSG